MNYQYLSDKGKKRQNNEDSCAVFCPNDQSCIAIVCDGMGGAEAGEVASSMAVDTVISRMKAGWRSDISPDSVKNLLLTSITAANIDIFDTAEADEALKGMGTTIVACVAIGDCVIIAHAGDSRAYLYDQSLRLLTKDHSYVQFLMDMGRITEDEAKDHPNKNLITRALGVDEMIEIDFSTIYISPGDKLLLCSDGLSNFVDEKEIERHLADFNEKTTENLIAAANENGGGDNITAVIVSFD